MILICNIYRDIDNLLSHFLKHYHNLGIVDFYFGIHGGESNPVWNRIETFNKWNLRIKKWKSYDGQINGYKEGDSERFLKSQVSENDWYIPTDLDEFHSIGEYKKFGDLIESCKNENADFVYADIIDRITKDGSIPLIVDPHVDIFRQFPIRSRITKPLLDAWDGKVILAKQSVELYDGHHYPKGFENPETFTLKEFSKKFEIDHFKWFGNLRQKEEEKLESYKNVGLGYYLENQKLLDYLIKHNNRLWEPPIQILSS